MPIMITMHAEGKDVNLLYLFLISINSSFVGIYLQIPWRFTICLINFATIPFHQYILFIYSFCELWGFSSGISFKCLSDVKKEGTSAVQISVVYFR